MFANARNDIKSRYERGIREYGISVKYTVRNGFNWGLIKPRYDIPKLTTLLASMIRNNIFACDISRHVSFRCVCSHTSHLCRRCYSDRATGRTKFLRRNSIFRHISATHTHVCVHTRVPSAEVEEAAGPSIVPQGWVYDFCEGDIPRVPLSCDVTFRPRRREIPAEFVVVRRDK